MKNAFITILIMDDFSDLFNDLLQSCGSVDIAEAEFKRMIADSQSLRADYRRWCSEYGYTERRGFLDYAEEFLDEQNSKLDTLTDYDNQD